MWEFPTVYISQKLRVRLNPLMSSYPRFTLFNIQVAKYLGGNIIVWGIILMCHAAASSFGAFFALRFLLGMCNQVQLGICDR